MTRHSLVLSTALSMAMVAGCDTGTDTSHRGVNQAEAEARSGGSCNLFDGCDPNDPFLNDKLAFKKKIRNPSHVANVQTTLNGSGLAGTFDVPGVGTVEITTTSFGPGDFVGALSLNGVRFFDLSMSPTVPEWNYSNQDLAALGLDESQAETIALATSEVWGDLGLNQPGSNLGFQSDRGWSFPSCEIETVPCDPKCKSIIFRTTCILCIKVKCKFGLSI